MPQWTLLGLLQGQSRPRPGHWLKEPMARRAFWACHATSRRYATTSAKRAPTYARPRRSPCALRPACRSAGYRLRSLHRLPALRRGVPHRSHDDVFRLGVRRTVAGRFDLERSARRKICYRRSSATRVPAQPAHSPCRCRLMQRLRIRAAGIKQSVLQPASPWHLLYCLAALCRPTVGYRAGHARHARALTRHLRSDGGAAVGACGRHVRRLRRGSRRAAMPRVTASMVSFRSMFICPAVHRIRRQSSKPC